MYITLNGFFEGFSTIRFPLVKLSNMKKKHVEDACSAKFTGAEYRASWSLSLVLNMPPKKTEAHVQHAFQTIFLPKKPDSVTNIEVRYTASALSAACNASPDPEARKLHVEGYIQLSKAKISLFDLDRWVPNTEWTPVGGQLIRNAAYKEYLASKKETSIYIHKQIHGTPALGKGGGSKPKAGKVS